MAFIRAVAGGGGGGGTITQENYASTFSYPTTIVGQVPNGFKPTALFIIGHASSNYRYLFYFDDNGNSIFIDSARGDANYWNASVTNNQLVLEAIRSGWNGQRFDAYLIGIV